MAFRTKLFIALGLTAALTVSGCEANNNRGSVPYTLDSESSAANALSSSESSSAVVSSVSESIPDKIEKPKIGELMGAEFLPVSEKAFCVCTNTAHNTDGSVMSVYYVVYDDHGNRIAIIDERQYYWAYEYDNDGDIVKQYDSITNSVTEYEYKGGQIVKRRYTNNDGDTSEETYEYDEHGTRIKDIHNVETPDYTYVTTVKPEYDELGRLVRSTGYNSDGSAYSTYEYEYNDKGEVIAETTYSADTKTERVYTYDERGNTLSEYVKRTKDADCSVTYEERTEYEYNSDNKVISTRSFEIKDGIETPGRYITSSYEY